MIVSQKIDWLSTTYNSKKVDMRELIPPYIEFKSIDIKSPIPVYPLAIEIVPLKIKMLYGREGHGVHVILSGQSFTALEQNEVSEQEIWNIISQNGGRVSRVDIAIDVQDCEAFTPLAVQQRYMAGECKTRFVGKKYIGEDSLETFYIGKMNNKNRRFRVYDKKIETDWTGKYWTRIEYEKRRNAHSTASAYFDANQSAQSIIKSVVDFPAWGLWQDIMGAEIAAVPRVKKDEKTYAEKLSWLVDNYPKAIVNTMIREYHDKLSDFDVISSDVLNTFAAVLSAEIRSAQLQGKLPMSKHENETKNGGGGSAGESGRAGDNLTT